jgi:hypothetical protein
MQRSTEIHHLPAWQPELLQFRPFCILLTCFNISVIIMEILGKKGKLL